MLTEHSGVLRFLSLEEATGLWVGHCPKQHSKPMAPASRGMQDTWGNSGNSPGTGWPGVKTVNPREVLPGVMWSVYVLQKFAETFDILFVYVCVRLFVISEPSFTT